MKGLDEFVQSFEQAGKLKRALWRHTCRIMQNFKPEVGFVVPQSTSGSTAGLVSVIRTEILRDAHGFLRYWDQISELRHELSVEDDVLLDPVHFLAATDDTRRSCSVACFDGSQLIGLIYATEHYVFGLKTGYAVGGDYSGRGLLLCRSEHEIQVVQAAVQQMQEKGIHALHLRMMPRDATRPNLSRARTKYLEALIPGDRMVLGDNYDAFLGTLGKHTRRNVRYYTRKAFAEGIEFVPALTQQEYLTGLERLNAETHFPADVLRLNRDERLLHLHHGVQRMGLRRPDGVLVAIVCGFSQGRRFHVLTQLNDTQYPHLSLSVVLRGCMAEHLIATGHDDLQFMGGSSLSFGRFCIPQRYRSIFVDKKWVFTAVAKLAFSKLVSQLDRFGKRVPEGLKMLSNGYLEDWRLTERTAVGPAAVAFTEGKLSVGRSVAVDAPS